MPSIIEQILEANRAKFLSMSPEEQRSGSLLNSAYQQVMGRAAGGTQGQFQGDSKSLMQGGFYGSMPALEAASMRLADAALGREMLAGEYKGLQESKLQETRGLQEMRLQSARGSQEMELQKLRGTQERGLQELRGSQGMELERLGGARESQLISQRAGEERRSEIERKIRELEGDRAEIGSRPWSTYNRSLYESLGKQISDLKGQIR